ncbi:MAG: phosphopyruvate hydratase [bacterium]
MPNNKIKNIKAREILDSRGNPTVEVDLTTEQGTFRSSVPSGASTGKYEAQELRDKGKRYQGKGVLRAVKNVNEIIAPKLKGKDATQQKEIDDLLIALDGTKNKSALGANAILPVSVAVCRAGSAGIPLYKYISRLAGRKCSLPTPGLNVINGGAHAGNDLSFQEFMIVPTAKTFAESLRRAAEIYHTLKEVLKKEFGPLATNVGDEGGFAPPLTMPEEALDLLMKAINQAGYKDKVKIILDVAASEFYVKGEYKMKDVTYSKEELLKYYLQLIKKYPLIGIEDPFAQDDWESFTEITKQLGSALCIIGDDFLTTNIERIKKAQSMQACNGLILKMNQIGTVSEAIAAAKYALDNNWQVFVKHRSGETTDDFIADLSVGLGAGWILTGAPARGERLAKYNQLLRIEEELL